MAKAGLARSGLARAGLAGTSPRTFHPGRVVSKLGLCTMYVLFAYAHLGALNDGGFRLSLVLLVCFETIMVGLVFVRRDSIEVDLSAMAISAGLVGSFAALGFRPATDGQEMLAGQIIQIFGVLLQLGSSFSLGRSFGMVPANRGIKTAGLYRLVRHPLYFSYLITEAGYLLSNPSARNMAVLVAGTGFQVLRIRYEERLLSRDIEYQRYALSVRWHMVPGFW